MGDEEWVRRDQRLSRRSWMQRKTMFCHHHHEIPQPWQVVCGQCEPDKNYYEFIGKKFVGSTPDAFSTDARRADTVKRVIQEMKKQDMSGQDIINTLLKWSEGINSVTKRYLPGFDVQKEIVEWGAAIVAYVGPVSNSIMNTAPKLFWTIVQKFVEMILELIPAILEFIFDVGGNATVEAAKYSLLSTTTGPVAGPIISFIL